MANYERENKLKAKYETIINEQNQKIVSLNGKIEKLENEIKEYRKKIYDLGSGKGELNSLKDQIASLEREKTTLNNLIKKLDNSSAISLFSIERQRLIKKIRQLSFKASKLDFLALKFKDGLDNVIKLAALIKSKGVKDIDYFTYIFRDNIIGLLEKIFNVLLCKYEDSATKYLYKLSIKSYSLPKSYYDRIPNLNNKKVLDNMLYLANIETTAYHGTKNKNKHIIIDPETKTTVKVDKFLNLSQSEQLTAIFTMLEFLYDVFTNKDYETILMAVSAHWFTTIQ